jgi:hypothetical protein
MACKLRAHELETLDQAAWNVNTNPLVKSPHPSVSDGVE